MLFFIKSAPPFYPITKRIYAKSEAILRRNKLSIKIVGAGALDSPLEGARFELSRAHVENIMWITQMRLQTKCRRVGLSRAPSPYKRDRIVFCSVLQWL